MASEELRKFAAVIDAATNTIAFGLRRMRDHLLEQGQLSPEDREEVDRMAARAEALAADPDNPDPLNPHAGTDPIDAFAMIDERPAS